MRTTLSITHDDRVAGGGDFIALGEGVAKTPGWRHAVVDFDYDGADAFTLRWIADIATGVTLAPTLSVSAMNNVAKHCRAYFNLIERLTNALPDPA